MMTRVRHVFGYLRQGSLLASHLEQLRQEQRLLQQVRKALPPGLRGRCLSASINDEQLTLVTDSPAWATPLRFLAPQVLKALAGTRPGLRDCRIRIRPAGATGSAPTQYQPSPPRLSPAAADHLLSAAEALADPELAGAFRRLAASASRRAERAPGEAPPVTNECLG